MARRITQGSVGGAGVGGFNITSTTLSAAEDLDIIVDPKGTGIFSVAGDTLLKSRGDLRFGDTDDSNFVAFQAPATIGTNITWTLPNADATAANQSLVSDGAGTLSWVTTGAQITDNTSDSGTNYVIFGTATTGTLLNVRTSSTKLTYTPSSGTLAASAAVFNGTVNALRQEVEYTADHTLQLSDRDKVVSMGNTGSVTLTIPSNSVAAFPVGSIVYIYRQAGAGAVAITAGAGATTTKDGTMAEQEEFYVRKRDTNEWVIVDSAEPLSASGGAVSSAAGFTVHTYTSGTGTFVV